MATPPPVILVPRREGIPERDAVWQWCKARWMKILPEARIYEGHHTEGPFNRSAAINRAAVLADRDGRWEHAIVIDADIFVKRSQVLAAIERARATGRVTWAHRRWRGLHQEWTERIIRDNRDLGDEFDGLDMDLWVERTNPISWSCCIVVPRAVWDDMGGFDERFRGWGFEDMAFQSAVVGLYGYERLDDEDVYHHWHPRSEERIVKGEPATTATPEYVMNGLLGRRYMIAARRDHGQHDRLERADAPEMSRDIENLMRDDQKFLLLAKRHRLPDWTGWYPTLRELLDGAKAARTDGKPTITVVMHSGGEDSQWEERAEYIWQSLESLNAMVSGPIVQRVIYSDWSKEPHAELTELAERYGFYVVGGGHYGYAPSMKRMFDYLQRRARGDYIFQVEDDFIYDVPVDLLDLHTVLEDREYLAQIALLRAPAYAREQEAGSVLATLKEPYQQATDGVRVWQEHRDHFTANPSLFRKSLTQRSWPQGKSSERLFGDAILRDKNARFAYYGDGTPYIHHIGEIRAGSAY